MMAPTHPCSLECAALSTTLVLRPLFDSQQTIELSHRPLRLIEVEVRETLEVVPDEVLIFITLSRILDMPRKVLPETTY